MTTPNRNLLAAEDLADMQGIILSGYGHLSLSEILLFRFEDPVGAKTWLSQLVDQVTTGCWDSDADGKAIKPQCALNVALSQAGLNLLGIDTESSMFSEEFIEGMAESRRSRRLGDEGDSAPDKWEFGGPRQEIHAILILQANTDDELKDFAEKQTLNAAGFSVKEAFPSQRGYMPPDSREHFGYVDSISQPNIEGSPARRKDSNPAITAGEFILGYTNGYGRLPPSPVVTAGAETRDLGRNGSYIVLRKLSQDVASFRSFLNGASSDPAWREVVRAKLVGRWNSGAPLAMSPTADDPSLHGANDFGYGQSDPNGMGCPIGAHIRRTNPRDSLGNNPQESSTNVNRHRIIRRGVLYGKKLDEGTLEDDGIDRGILFIAINADIRRQFEFVQQTWSTNPKFGGLYSDPDPFASGGTPHKSRHFTIPRTPVRERITDMPQFVTVRGGGYFFLPSVAALKYFATGDPQVLRIKPD